MSALSGVLDKKIEEKCHWTTNKIGGSPAWIDDACLQLQSSCDICSKPQALVVQLYCPIDESENHRSILVFCCLDKYCWVQQSGWSAYRMLKLLEKPTVNVNKTKTDISTSWTFDQDDWGDDDSSQVENQLNCDNEKPIDELLQDVSIQDGSLVAMSKLVNFQSCKYFPQFEPYYINVYEEKSLETENSTSEEHIEKLINSYNQSGLNEESTSNEHYEKNSSGNKVFRKFNNVVRSCPNLAIRYSYSGEALYLSEDAQKLAKSSPVCKECGQNCVFEFQLMPALIPFLKHEKNEIEYGTVLIFTCKDNCQIKKPLSTGVQLLREQILLFGDLDLKFFKNHEKKL